MVLVLGPTASGKSEAALQIAKRVGGEIVSGDAFAVYRGLDIGTAKPPAEWRSAVPHHLLDIADPREPFSAGEWAGRARKAVEEIEARGRVPVVAGGSHFYVRALLSRLPGEAVKSSALREYLSARRGAEARRNRKRILDLLDPEYAALVPVGDTARLNRAVEILFTTGARVSERTSPPENWASRRRVLKIALQISGEDLYTRIQVRLRKMWDAGWPREVERLLAAGVPRGANCFRAIGYSEVADFVDGKIERAAALEKISLRTRALVKRQKTWLGREPRLSWYSLEEAVEAAVAFCGGR
jgi:tRNA dimethylallyltransferase